MFVGEGTRLHSDPEYDVAGGLFDIADTNDIGASPFHLVLAQDGVYLENQVVLPQGAQVVGNHEVTRSHGRSPYKAPTGPEAYPEQTSLANTSLEGRPA